MRAEKTVLSFLDLSSVEDSIRSRTSPRIDVCDNDLLIVGVPAHRPGPPGSPFLHRLIGHVRTLGEGCSTETSTHVRHPAHGNALTDSVQVEESP